MVQIFALIVLLFWIISRIRRSSKLFTGMVALFAICVIVGAGVKKAIADSKAKSDITTVVVSDDDSTNNNTFGVFDSLKNWQMTAPEGHVTVTLHPQVSDGPIPSSHEHPLVAGRNIHDDVFDVTRLEKGPPCIAIARDLKRAVNGDPSIIKLAVARDGKLVYMEVPRPGEPAVVIILDG